MFAVKSGLFVGNDLGIAIDEKGYFIVLSFTGKEVLGIGKDENEINQWTERKDGVRVKCDILEVYASFD